jgi:acetyl-CoA carboxylase biotin carboxyl carrier protein
LISPKTKKYFIAENQNISVDDIIGIIVSMKAEYPVKSTESGRIKNILIENAQPVEFGQPLIELEM